MAYRRVEWDLERAPEAIALTPEEDGVGLIARLGDQLIGFAMIGATPGAALSEAELESLAAERFAQSLLAARARKELTARPPATPAPALSIAICTKDRPERLMRLLASLEPLVRQSPFAAVEVLVVDNAPCDDATRLVVETRAFARYLREPKVGLDFARNAALRAATGDLLAFLDDDVVVDRGWLRGLHAAWLARPDAGGFTGLVLPYRLDTEAQVRFELGGGFGRGFRNQTFHAERHGNRLHPVGAGILGAGCNMCFDRRLLLELGGFDEALDTGAPLPGGGDLDIFYRVLRSGRPMVYAPAYAVFHEHRETVPQLRRQYFTWGLGFMAFLAKARRADPTLRDRHRAMVWWWLLDRLAAMVRALLRGRRREFGFARAEFAGGLQGLAGEYGRSVRRSARIREAAA